MVNLIGLTGSFVSEGALCQSHAGCASCLARISLCPHSQRGGGAMEKGGREREKSASQPKETGLHT